MSYIVIGAATQVSFNGACVLSAQWTFAPNVQRLYCVGEWTPNATYYKPTESLNLTIYAPGPTYSTEPSETCADANTIAASVTPYDCGGNIGSFSGNWLVTSYSYTKQDKGLPGQETWALTRWKNLSTNTPSSYTIEPTYVLRGITEGSATGDAGIEFNGDTYESSQGSVASNSFGTAEIMTNGTISMVGGGSSAMGDTGQGSASIPYTPLYI